jgi:hypothetical protein
MFLHLYRKGTPNVDLDDISLTNEEVSEAFDKERADRDARRKSPAPRKRAVPILGAFYPAIPEAWIETAARLPGKALHVALILRRKSVLTRSAAVYLTTNDIMPLGVDRSAKRHALCEMEKAGLVIVDRRNGRSPLVTIIPMED